MGEQTMKIAPLTHTALAGALLFLALPIAPAASASSAAAPIDVQAAPLPDLQPVPLPDAQATPLPDSQAAPPDSAAPGSQDETYGVDEIVQNAAGFFGATTEVIAKVVEGVFGRFGRPNAYIAGEEGSGAFFVGLRYGAGNLYMKSNGNHPTKIYWQGPSIGFDIGANASKTFTLVYNLPDPEAIYERFPGIEGSAYYVAGIGVNYQQSGHVVLVPMRTGVGLRTGVNGGYLSYSKERNWLPF
jgi:hypothetical protein